MAEPTTWVECFAGDARFEADDVPSVVERFLAHANDDHDWPFPEQALRNFATNFAEASVRLAGAPTERLTEIGEVEIHPVSADRIDDWLAFFDRDAFAGNPSWASCYCLEPHEPATDEEPELPWRQVRSTMIGRLGSGGAYGYLAYVEGAPAGWINASFRSDYALYRDVDPDGPDPVAVVAVSCIVVAPPYRRHGLAAALLDRVIADAAGRGAAWIEAYPHNEPEDGDSGHFRGPRQIYDARGFVAVAERERDTVVRRPVG